MTWEHARTDDPALLARLDELTAIVAAAQRPDGYLDSVVELRKRPRYHELGWSHELDPADVTLIPYYAWANRGPQPMRVWLPAM